jgi:CDP-6-deoxy-D-xylo-4-hexulose-3-dehydrase
MGITSGVGVIEKRVLYAQAVFGREEVNAVVKSLENGWLASGPLVKKFEQSVASLFGKKYGIAVNSGSSANLLVISALGAQKGSEIITPACTFSTTVSNIVNCGYKPVFVDSVVGRYTINEDLVEAAINSKTCAIMVPQLIGGICDMTRLYEIAKKHNLVLIDDSCDTLAPTIKGHQVYRCSRLTPHLRSHIITANEWEGW